MERLQIEIQVDDRGSPALRTFNAQLERTDKLAQAASGGFTKLERNIITIASGLEIAARAANLAARTFDALLGNVVKRGEELQTLSRRLSINVETLSRFDFAAKQAGVNLEGLGQGFRKLATALVEAEQKGSRANQILVQGLGFTVQQLKALQGDPQRALLALGDAFNRYGDSAKKTAAAAEIFGRGFQDVLVLFKEGRAEIEKNIALSERLGQTWTTGQAAAADRLGDSVTTLVASLQAFGSEVLKNEDLLNRLADVVDTTRDRLIAFREGLTPEQIGAINDGIVAMTKLMGGLAEILLTVGSRAAQAIGSLASLFGSARDIHQLSGEAASAQAVLEARLRERGVPFTREGRRLIFDTPGGFSPVPGPEASFLPPGFVVPPAPPAPPSTGGGPAFPFPPKGGGGGGADKQTRALDAYNDAVRKLREELTLLQDPSQKVRIEQERQVKALTDLATAAGVKLTPEILDLARALPRLEAETKAAEQAAKEHAKALEEGAKLARSLSDRLEEMADPLAATRHEFRDLREEAAKLPNAVELNPLIDQLERAAIATEQWGGVFDQLARVAENALEGIILGTRDAGDAFEALKQAAVSELTQIAIGVAKAGVISAISGTPQAPSGATGLFGSLLFGTGGLGSGGGLLGSLLGGGSGGGGLGGLLNVGGGSGGTPSTFGIPSLLKQALFGGSTLAFAGPTLAGLNAAATTSPLAISIPTTIGPAIQGFQGGVGAGAGGAGAGLSALTAYAGLALALGLGAKGIVDTRSDFSRATLGAAGSNAAGNRLTAIQGITLAAGTAAGAGIGAGVGTAAFPGIGTVIGAGVGAAVAAAVADAVGRSVTGSISAGVRSGLTQSQLEKKVTNDLTENPLLIALGGLAHLLASKVLGPAVTPDIENIFAKVFRQAVGGEGGLDTTGIPVGASGFAGLKPFAGQAGQASRIIAQAFGAGGDAFGAEREGNFVSILLGGVAKRIKKEGGDAGQIIAETFAGAFNGKFLNALSAIFTERKGLRDADLRFAAEQFAKGSPAFGFNYQRVVNAAIEGERVPGKPARRRSREAFGTAFQAALQNPDDPLAFQRSVQGSFVGAAAEGFSTAIANSSLGIGFADIFAPDRDERKALRRARRSGGAEAAITTLTAQFQENIGEFVAAVNDPAYAKAIQTFTDGVFKLGVVTSTAAGDIDGARAQIVGRLQSRIDTVKGVQQLRRDVVSRVGFLQSGPGFAQSELAIEDLARQRQEVQDRLSRRPSARTGPNFLKNLQTVTQFTLDKDIPQLLADVQEFTTLRLAELEAETALARQMRDYFRGVREAFQGIRDSIDVTRRGPRALQDILTRQQDEVTRLLPVALGPAGEDQQRAIERINQLLPQILQLGSQLFAPGSASLDALLTFADRTAGKLINSATAQEAAAEARLDQAVKNAQEFKDEILPTLAQIQDRASGALLTELSRIEFILGGTDQAGGILGVMREVRDNILNLTGKKKQAGGPVIGGQAYVVGEAGPEVFVPQQSGTIIPNGGSAPTVTVPITVHVGAGMTPEQIADAVTQEVRARRRDLVTEIRRAVA